MNESETIIYQIPFRKLDSIPSEAFPALTSRFFPLVPVTLRHGNHEIQCQSIIDSGADYSIFPISFAERLGLDIKLGKTASISDSEEKAYFFQIRVTLEENIHFPLYAGFSKHAETRKFGLLGQKGFFDKFEVRFCQTEGKIGLVVKSDSVEISTRNDENVT